MQSNGSRLLVGLAAAVVVVIAFFVLKGDEEAGEGSSVEDTPAETTKAGAQAQSPGSEDGEKSNTPKPKPEVATIVLEDGQPKGGAAELTFAKGDEVRFSVESNVDDEIHVHGYDLEQEVAAGEVTEVHFPAEIDGIFEIESHGYATEIAELTINP